ncbi:MAG TPA: maleylpyruvate isomerase N-terminal domain-containing protein [Phycicoccus sp.]|nr:maleylpyruvate isomerase N-terminal domain-containing protein [Phycicoccus sp.]
MDALAGSREWFAGASDAVVGLVAAVPQDAWEGPGLGEWSVRELVAHTLRAWTTVHDYLGEPVPAEGTPGLTAAQYLARGLVLPGIHEGVAQRARDDVARLGTDPAGAARAVADEVTALVATVVDERLLPTRIGVMTVGEYLRTRAFELTVHGLDVARAVGVTVPEDLAGCVPPALVLVAEVAAERGLAAPLLEAATGRAPLPDGFSLLS